MALGVTTRGAGEWRHQGEMVITAPDKKSPSLLPSILPVSTVHPVQVLAPSHHHPPSWWLQPPTSHQGQLAMVRCAGFRFKIRIYIY